jgi:hypothetical protein
MDETRASDAEREQTAEQLRHALVEGRLSLEEFTERIGYAQEARTHAELADAVRDLPAQPPVLASEPRQLRTLCSRLARSGAWRVPARSSYRAIFGTVDLDLRQATLEAPHVELEIYNLFSTVTVLVPEGALVTVTGGGLFATQLIEHPAAPPLSGAPELRIRLSGPGGTTRVRYREPVSAWRRLVAPPPA